MSSKLSYNLLIVDNVRLPNFITQNVLVHNVYDTGTGTHCRQLFRDYKILKVTSLHLHGVLCI